MKKTQNKGCRAQNKGWSPVTDRTKLAGDHLKFIMGGQGDHPLFSDYTLFSDQIIDLLGIVYH